jgi:hypothetical protein
VNEINVIQDMKYYKLIDSYSFEGKRYYLNKKVSFDDKFVKLIYDDKIIETLSETLALSDINEENYKEISYEDMKIMIQFLRSREIYNPTEEMLKLFDKCKINYIEDAEYKKIMSFSENNIPVNNNLKHYYSFIPCLTEKKFNADLVFRLDNPDINKLWLIVDYDTKLILKHPYDLFNHITLLDKNSLNPKIILFNNLAWYLTHKKK